MTTPKYSMPTMEDLMKKIDDLEQKLVPPPKPDMNQLLREMVDRKVDGRRGRGMFDVRTITNKEHTNG